MITNAQHARICRLVRLIKWLGFDVHTHTGHKITRVELEIDGSPGDFIYLENKEFISHRSYQEATGYKQALTRFRITIDLHDLMTLRRWARRFDK